MDRDLFEKQWFQIRDTIKERWNKLTDEDIRQINGRYDQFVAKLQQRYGYTREEIDDEFRKWSPDRSFDRGTTSAYTHPNKERDTTSSLTKWLVFAGLPLLLLALWLANDHTKTDTTTTTTTRAPIETNRMEATNDQTITQNIRQTLAASERTAPIVNSLRILTNNGIVTLSGTVGTSQERDNIVRIVEATPGVRQVRNELEVR